MERISQYPSKLQDVKAFKQTRELNEPEDLIDQIKTFTEQLNDGNGIIWNRDDPSFVENHTPICSSDVQLDKERTNQMNESTQVEDLQDVKTFIEQFIDGDGNIWNRDNPGFLDNHNNYFEKIEDVSVLKDGEVSPVHLGQEQENCRKTREHPCIFHPCSYKTNNEKNLLNHFKNSHPYKFETCTRCYFTSPSIADIISHFKKEHQGTSNCELCDYSTNNKQNLSQHIRTVHTDRLFKCHICKYASKTLGVLRSHIENVHLKIKKYKCHHCEYVCGDSCYLKLHIRAIHLKLMDFKCDMCSYESARKQSVHFHKIRMHSNIKKEKCQFCDFTTNRKEYLKSHINAVHLLIRNEKCHFCDFVTARKYNLKTHIKKVHLKTKK